jgi:hypothetical protein
LHAASATGTSLFPLSTPPISLSDAPSRLGWAALRG